MSNLVWISLIFLLILIIALVILYLTMGNTSKSDGATNYLQVPNTHYPNERGKNPVTPPIVPAPSTAKVNPTRIEQEKQSPESDDDSYDPIDKIIGRKKTPLGFEDSSCESVHSRSDRTLNKLLKHISDSNELDYTSDDSVEGLLGGRRKRNGVWFRESCDSEKEQFKLQESKSRGTEKMNLREPYEPGSEGIKLRESKGSRKEKYDLHESRSQGHDNIRVAERGSRKDHINIREPHESSNGGINLREQRSQGEKFRMAERGSQGEKFRMNERGSQGENLRMNERGSQGENLRVNERGSQGENLRMNERGSQGENLRMNERGSRGENLRLAESGSRKGGGVKINESGQNNCNIKVGETGQNNCNIGINEAGACNQNLGLGGAECKGPNYVSLSAGDVSDKDDVAVRGYDDDLDEDPVPKSKQKTRVNINNNSSKRASIDDKSDPVVVNDANNQGSPGFQQLLSLYGPGSPNSPLTQIEKSRKSVQSINDYQLYYNNKNTNIPIKLPLANNEKILGLVDYHSQIAVLSTRCLYLLGKPPELRIYNYPEDVDLNCLVKLDCELDKTHEETTYTGVEREKLYTIANGILCEILLDKDQVHLSAVSDKINTNVKELLVTRDGKTLLVRYANKTDVWVYGDKKLKMQSSSDYSGPLAIGNNIYRRCDKANSIITDNGQTIVPNEKTKLVMLKNGLYWYRY